MFRIINEETTPTAGCTWTDWTDEELLQEYRCTGIREIFEEIVIRYEQELYKYLYYNLGNATDAEDVFQKTFMAVLQNCDKFDESRKFRSWLYGLAAHKVSDHRRQAKHHIRATRSIDEEIGNASATYSIADTLEGSEPQPFEDPMDKEIAQKVREAVEALPESMRQAVYMVYFQGLSYREAADAVGIHYSKLSHRLSSAVKKLNFLLKNVG